ncbi:MAG: flavin reductase [Firmicutes bacterium]|nr:flavin reductase [Bacillota bacterium]MBQ1715012.1 flavin reductase [Bacillota bacterium]MEE3383342.1 flavin reductase [Anaerovoracaceae bacterium]
MYCTKKILDDLYWVGANDRRLAMFEGVYSVPRGVSYNSYLLLDEKTVLFDTVDKAVGPIFFQNVEHVLNGRKLDYLVVQHMEPDHSATMMELLLRYPDVTVICNQMTMNMIKQFFNRDLSGQSLIIKDGDTFTSGKHNFTFYSAPMVHWPEVMMTYEHEDCVLFTADAFGTFGALNGAIFADEVDFDNEYMDEARRYYTNIVGKYGEQVQQILKKAHSLEIKMICPLHGFVWRRKLESFIDKYVKWATYTPEETGVVVAYASVYGNTENVAEIISSGLRDRGVKTVMFDVSVTPASEMIAACFQYSHMVFCSTTYNAGIFVSMEEFLRDLAAHNLQNRTVALVENGSWAPTSGRLMKEILSPLKNVNILNESVTLKSSLKPGQEAEVEALIDAIDRTIPKFEAPVIDEKAMADAVVDPDVFKKFSYGLFVLTAKADGKDNGCIINTGVQLTSNPNRVTIAVNKANFTHDMIKATGMFNLSFLSESAVFGTFKHFGFQTGREVNKFDEHIPVSYRHSANGLAYITTGANAFMSCKVVDSYDYGTHTLFVADVVEAGILSDEPSVTYAYYFAHIKPKPQEKLEEERHGWVCKICGYFYEGEELPADFVCPLCKHGADDFERVG